MTLGGLLSARQLPKIALEKVPDLFRAEKYRSESHVFGKDEEHVRNFMIRLLKQLGWENVNKHNDIFAEKGEAKLLVECKANNPRLLYLEDHKGSKQDENAV